MKLKIRYENEIQTIELDAKATEEMWVSLSLEGEGLSQKEREELIQKEWNEQFNKGDYNNWHKFNRHRGYSKAVPDEETEEVDCSEPLMSEVRDPRIFCRQELDKDKQYDYEACCNRIRVAVKPAQADMLIAIILDGMTVAEYKEKSTEKIDGAIATIMGLDRAIRCGNDVSTSVYDEQGILFI